MNMNTLKNKKALVVGLGKSGVAVARHLCGEGMSVTAMDSKSRDMLADSIAMLSGLDINFVLGNVGVEGASEYDIVVTSPGVPHDLPGLDEARRAGIQVVGEMELAVRKIDKPIVAITGTNGKTTTTALTGHLLEKSGLKVCVAGNIGSPLISELDNARKSDVVVLEVSSFQLESAPSLSPHVAVWLNLTPDHLDRHGGVDNYAESKAKLFKQASGDSWGIYNALDKIVADSVVTSDIKLVPFDSSVKLISDDTQASSGPRAWFDSSDLCIDLFGRGPNRYSLKGVALTGAHNRENMLAALAAAEICGAKPELLQIALESFKGLPHRMEYVGSYNDVKYYNDSKGTNVGATVRAIEECGGPVVLIAGGREKDTDFAPLAPAVSSGVKKVILIGEAANAIESAVAGCVDVVRASSMLDAVRAAASFAAPGDNVLLSPACASFDMFSDYADRGHKFVQALTEVAGGNLRI
jgi:UDP-N-acetylmuramoylalanine--D-glutamate ligase